jgi:glycosyltransferase involved in cell wall biosynthesis
MHEHAMRIAFITGGLAFGGTTTFLQNLASGLIQAGVPCEIYSFTDANPFATEFARDGITVHTYDENRLIFEDRLIQILVAIARFKPTVVVANIGREAYEVLRYLPHGILRVGMIHDRVMQPERLIPDYRDVLDKVVVVSAHLLEDLRRVAPDLSCAYLAHGIPLDEKTRNRETNPTGPLKLIYFGRLTEGKGSRLFPLIVDALHQRKIPFQWTIHGQGEGELELRKRLASETVSGEIIFSTPVPRGELPELVRRHDIYVHAADTEGGPLTLIEAMALGLVPVCGDIPCLIQEIITPENGFRVPRSNPDAYAAAVNRLHADRGQLERLSQAAKAAIVAEFTVDAMARRYLTFFGSSKPTTAEVVWPQTVNVQPVAGSNPLRYWKPLRVIRRLIRQTTIMWRQ